MLAGEQSLLCGFPPLCRALPRLAGRECGA